MADSFYDQISALVKRIANEFKTAYGMIGKLEGLQTDQKDSIVNALNSLQAKFQEEEAKVTALINDEEDGSDKTYSSNKITEVVNEAKEAVKNELLNGAGDAYDTLKEIEDALKEQTNAVEALKTLCAKKYVERQVTDSDKESLVFNEKDGGGVKMTTADAMSFVGVNDGTGDVLAEVYALAKDSKQGTRLIVNKDGIYYTNGKTDLTFDATNEIATKADLGVTEGGEAPDFVAAFEAALAE